MRGIHVGGLRVGAIIIASIEIEVASRVGQYPAADFGTSTSRTPWLPVGPGLVGPDGVPLPASQHVAHKGVAGMREPRQLVYVVEYHPVANVVDGVAAVQAGNRLARGEPF